MIDNGIINSAKLGVKTPLPVSWLGRADSPSTLPTWANIDKLTATQVRCLQAQIGYDASVWDYRKIGSNNQLGRYQFTTDQLEDYGIIAYGSNQAYSTDCINRIVCWKPSVIRSSNSYANYIYNITTLDEFLNSQATQDHLCYQRIYDLYSMLTSTGAIQLTDSAEVVGGMIYVGWVLGTEAYNWRYHNMGPGALPYNSGRYAIAVLSQ